MREERKQEVRINRRIRVPEVRVIDAEGEQRGIMPTQDAIKLAEESGLDLVEVSPSARPSVCRIMDFGKYKYLQKKKASEHKAVEVQTKELKLGYKTGEHDVDVRVRHAVEFLTEGHRVRVILRMVGRENAHVPLARAQLEAFVAKVGAVGMVEGGIRHEGKNLVVQLVKATGGASRSL